MGRIEAKSVNYLLKYVSLLKWTRSQRLSRNQFTCYSIPQYMIMFGLTLYVIVTMYFFFVIYLFASLGDCFVVNLNSLTIHIKVNVTFVYSYPSKIVILWDFGNSFHHIAIEHQCFTNFQPPSKAMALGEISAPLTLCGHKRATCLRRSYFYI